MNVASGRPGKLRSISIAQLVSGESWSEQCRCLAEVTVDKTLAGVKLKRAGRTVDLLPTVIVLRSVCAHCHRNSNNIELATMSAVKRPLSRRTLKTYLVTSWIMVHHCRLYARGRMRQVSAWIMSQLYLNIRM
jgi:hypothetical protein